MKKFFDRQVLELKRLIERFNPKEVVIDINGLGVAFADCMIKETFDSDRNISCRPTDSLIEMNMIIFNLVIVLKFFMV